MKALLRGCPLLLFLCTTLIAAAPARAEKRIALVIGVGAYQNAPALANPVNDAHAIGDALRRLNFDVEELYDPDLHALMEGVREFGIHAQTADAAVIYYAGHGVQVDRENYLVPVDAKLERERDLLYEAMPLSLMLGEVAQVKKVGIVLLDACRNNPFIDRITRSLTVADRSIATNPGLARVDNVPPNVLVAMATKANAVADDGDTGHSPFAAALLAHFPIPGLELSLFFRSVRDTVLKATDNRQEPYIFSSLGAEPFYFFPRRNLPPEIGTIKPLEVLDIAGPTPLGIPAPSDPDRDPLTVRFIGLPRSGQVRVEGRVVTPGEVFSVDRFLEATFKPDGKMLGPIGTIDLLIDNGHGASITASLPITVKPSIHPPIVEATRTLLVAPTAMAIRPPTDPDNYPLTVTVEGLPRGVVRLGDNAVKLGDRLAPADLANLSIMPEASVVGSAGSLRYLVQDGRGGNTEGRLDVEVTGKAQAAQPLAAATPPPAPAPVEVAAASPASEPAPPLAPMAKQPVATEQLALLQPPPVPREVLPRLVAPTPPPALPGLAGAFRDCPDCPSLVHIPAGSFIMGEGAHYPDSLPPHRVTLRGFALGEFPVTVAEWKLCVAERGCFGMPRMAAAVEDRAPVHNLSWDDTQQYLGWLSRRAGRKYRLPSESEWEYAARAGTTTRYWWGNEAGVWLANCANCGGRQNVQVPLPVDTFKPNAFGLYDMLGGVAQWTADCWVPGYRGAPDDGSPREVHDCMTRVLRGGSFRSDRDDIAVSSRANYDAPVRYIVNGFRVARDE